MHCLLQTMWPLVCMTDYVNIMASNNVGKTGSFVIGRKPLSLLFGKVKKKILLLEEILTEKKKRKKNPRRSLGVSMAVWFRSFPCNHRILSSVSRHVTIDKCLGFAKALLKYLVGEQPLTP